jgi:hypothetical protein
VCNAGEKTEGMQGREEGWKERRKRINKRNITGK